MDGVSACDIKECSDSSLDCNHLLMMRDGQCKDYKK